MFLFVLLGIASFAPPPGVVIQTGDGKLVAPDGRGGWQFVELAKSDPLRGLTSEELRRIDPWYDWADGKPPRPTPTPNGYWTRIRERGADGKTRHPLVWVATPGK